MIDYGALDRDRPIVPRAQACSEWSPLEWAIVVQQHCDEEPAVDPAQRAASLARARRAGAAAGGMTKEETEQLQRLEESARHFMNRLDEAQTAIRWLLFARFAETAGPPPPRVVAAIKASLDQ